MIILDYWSGTPDRAREVWYNPQTIEIIRHYTRTQVEILTVTAFDPIENTQKQDDTQQVRVLNPPQFQFQEKNSSIILDYTSDVAGIPESIDIITVLHPTPAIILDDPLMNNETYLSHIPKLLKTIKDRMTPWGHVFLQLDYHYRKMEERLFGCNDHEKGFVRRLMAWGWISEVAIENPPTLFPTEGKFDRLSLHVFKKNC
jgi:hypothetical protein